MTPEEKAREEIDNLPVSFRLLMEQTRIVAEVERRLSVVEELESVVSAKPYPVAVRVLSFEQRYTVRDPQHSQPAVATFATALRSQFDAETPQRTPTSPARPQPAVQPATQLVLSAEPEEPADDGRPDVLETIEARATAAVRADTNILAQLNGDGLRWGLLQRFIFENALLQSMDGGFDNVAYNMVRRVLDAIYGPQGQGWHSFKREGKAWVKVGPLPN